MTSETKNNYSEGKTMSSEILNKSNAIKGRKRRKLNSPVNLGLAAVLIALVAFWLGGMLQADSNDSGAASPPFGDMNGTPPGLNSGDGSSTRGEVTGLQGNTLYVSSSDGTTRKVKVDSGATVTRNAEVKASQIRPGDTVVISGEKNKSGAVKAESVTATQSGVEAGMPGL